MNFPMIIIVYMAVVLVLRTWVLGFELPFTSLNLRPHTPTHAFIQLTKVFYNTSFFTKAPSVGHREKYGRLYMAKLQHMSIEQLINFWRFHVQKYSLIFFSFTSFWGSLKKYIYILIISTNNVISVKYYHDEDTTIICKQACSFY
jgi:hypothetical protein